MPLIPTNKFCYNFMYLLRQFHDSFYLQKISGLSRDKIVIALASPVQIIGYGQRIKHAFRL